MIMEMNNSPEIFKSLNIGTWVLEIDEGCKPRMYMDELMLGLCGIDCCPDPETTYELWHKGIDSEADAMLGVNLARMRNGDISEVEYKWTHPDGSHRYIRCGGQRDWTYTKGLRCMGTHRDVSKLRHIDEEWKQRNRILKSYSNYYDARNAHGVLLVNMESGSYFTIKTREEFENVLPLGESGSYMKYMQAYADHFVQPGYRETFLKIADLKFLESEFRRTPVYRTHFLIMAPDGKVRWYRITVNNLSNNEMVVSFEDRTMKTSEGLFWRATSNKLTGGFIIDLNRDSVTAIRVTSFFDFLGNRTRFSIKMGVAMLANRIDPEYREDWLKFADKENLLSVFKNHRRADFPFKAYINGVSTWMRASLYSVDVTGYNEASLVLAFRKYSREELDIIDQYQKIEEQNEHLENDLKLINGLTAQYVALATVHLDSGRFMIFKDAPEKFALNFRHPDKTYWDLYKEQVVEHCHPEDMYKLKKFSDPNHVAMTLQGRRRIMERFRFRTVDGNYIWVDQVLIRFDKDLDVRLTQFASCLVNVDHEVRKELAYQKAIDEARISKEESMLKTRFVNNISHDIRTPLNAVIGYSQLLALAGDTLSEEERQEYTNYIMSSGEMLTMLVDDILSISDIEHDIIKLTLGNVYCNEIGRKAVACSMMRVPVGVNLYYTTEFGDDFCINSDARRIQQILINMISNSCKATREGEIRVHCGKSGMQGFVDMSVTDTGCGVSPEKAKQIFSRFVSDDTNHSQSGHGLGLDICSDLSRRMGGKIWLDDTYKGGARFVLTLPSK